MALHDDLGFNSGGNSDDGTTYEKVFIWFAVLVRSYFELVDFSRMQDNLFEAAQSSCQTKSNVTRLD